MSAKTRFLNSVSGIALTAALVAMAMPARADTDDASGSAMPFGPGFNQNHTVTTVPFVEAESGDSSNAVEVTGIVFGNAAFNHLNAIGVYVNQWDIEASGAFDLDSGLTAGALATNSATVSGSIIGTVINPDFAPGTGSYGVRVADDIQAETANSRASYDGGGDPSVTSIARNSIFADGEVAGSAINSFGVRVDGEVHSTFANAQLRIDNYTDPTDIAFGSAQALNFVAITGTVGGEGASDGSFGFYVGGDVYADDAAADGGTFVFIEGLNVNVNVASVWSSGTAAADILASNTVALAGAVIGDGGNLATGVYVGGNVFAEGAWAAGEAISDGGQNVASAAYIEVEARNTVVVEGAVSGVNGPATGVEIVGDVFAEDAAAIGEAIAAFNPGYYNGGTPSARAEIVAIAVNAVSITGLASADGGTGVVIGEGAFAEGASAEGFAGVNLYELSFDVPEAAATATAHAANVVVVTGTAEADNAKGVDIGGDIFANDANADAYATAYAEFVAVPEGVLAAVTANASVVATASNAIAIVGIVDPSLTNAQGVDPLDVYATNANAYGNAYANALSNGGAGATATATSSIAATNSVGVSGSIGDGASGSTGVLIDQAVYSEFAYANGYASADATQLNGDTLVPSGASATAVNTVLAHNSAVIGGTLGNSVDGSAGVNIGYGVDAYWADAYGSANAYSTVDAGGVTDSVASAEGSVSALNEARILGVVGTDAFESAGVVIGEGVYAAFAFADGYSSANSYNSNGLGSANATADNFVRGENIASATGGLGDNAVDSTGVRIGWDIEAYNASANGNASAYANVFAPATSNGDATATATNQVRAGNGAFATGILGNVAEGSTGLWVGEDVDAVFAEASGSSRATATIYGGNESDATATSDNDVSAGNIAAVLGIVGDDASGSLGVYIGEGVAAAGAFAEGYANAWAYNDLTGGNATAAASNTIAARNTASVTGFVGNNAQWANDVYPDGVYIGEGVTAVDAFAEGSAYANANLTNGEGDGIASATANNAVVAGNSASITGTIGTGAEGAGGVYIDGTNFVFGAFGPPVFAGVAAMNAFAEGSAYAEANGTGGTGAVQATATNNVAASNGILIVGSVGADGSEVVGVGIDEGLVVAAFAEAVGNANAYATKSGGNGDATAQVGGTIVASNGVGIGGSVGDASYNATGVYIGEGPVVAGLAEGAGNFYASANRNGVENGNATAGVGASLAPAIVAATNLVAVGGTVSGINGEGGGVQENFGVWIGEGVGAVGALAEGSFGANAWRNDSGNGTASASVHGGVVAANDVLINGLVTAGTTIDGAYVGEGSSGVFIGGDVVALGALAEGNAYSNAYRQDGGTTGDAIAASDLGVVARNQILIGGEVGSFNDESTGVHIGEGVTAAAAFADGSARAYADNTSAANGVATATATLGMFATNNIAIGGEVGTSTLATSSDGVWIGEGVTATLAFAEGSADATAYRNGAGNGNATATAGTSITASNLIGIGGTIGDNLNDGSVGVYIGDGVSASLAFAEGTASAYAEHVGPGTGIATAAALSNVAAANIVGIAGTVGVDSWFAYGVDPLFVNASDATAISSASATAHGPAGSTAIATATATASNIVDVNGTVATQHNNGVGVWILGDVTALNAFAEGSTNVTTSGGATGTGTATATAFNLVDLTGSVAANGDGSTGIYIGNNVVVGGLGVSLSNYADAGAGTTITSTATGAMYNVVTIAGDVGSGVNATNSTGVYIGGNVEFGGINGSSLNSSLNGDGASTALQVVEAGNFATITGAVGTTSSGSHGVWIGGNVEVTNDLVSTFIIEGSDATNDGSTRGVYIGGSVLTGDALNSQYDSNADNNNSANPAIPAPLQIGDYVELAGSVFIGANGGTISHGVAVGGGNDTVLVRDTHFQMEVVNGFDGGSNPSPDGQDVITFSNAQIFVSNIDNFELMNVRNHSAVILTNPSPYIYAVRDEVNISDHSILMFGDGGAPPPFPIANGAPVNNAVLTTELLTIGGVQGVPTGGFDDSILKAENNGTGSYIVNAEVFNFGTITLSKVLSVRRGTDPHGLLYNSATSFDEDVEQQFWAVNGSWNIDPTSGPGDFLQINGNYTAGSDVILDTFVFKSTSPSDVVEINGDVAGVTTVWINNTNTTGTGAFTGNGPNDGILVVDVNNVQDPNLVGQAFVLGNTSGWNWADPVNFPEPEMQVGAFVYTLNQGGPDDRNFYLRSQLLDQVPAYTVMTSAIQQHFYAELGTLYQRMGELRHADLGSKANTSFFEFWMRAYGQDVNMDPKEGFEFDMTSKGFMIGGDYAVRNWLGAQSRLHLGGFGGYGWTKLDDIKGEGAVGNSDGKTDGYTLGLYATYFDTAKKHQGLYADAVVKFNFLDSEYSSSTRDTKAKSDDFAWGASLELGYGIGLGNGFIIQPQGQLSYMQVSKEKFKESSSPGIPLEVERDKGESLRGRLGLQLQNTWVTSGGTQFSPYIIGNVLHEFMGDNKTTVSGTPFHNDMGGTWYNAGAGFTVDFDNVGLYGHIEYNFGERIEGLAAGLGVKIKLGGSSPVAAAAPPPAPPAAPKKNYIVFFDFDRSNITADAQRVIDEAATAAKAGNSARVQLTGHTDRSGSEQYNMALSMRRGEAVKQAMIARGIPANSIVIISRGETQPLVPTADGVREPQNRRVEIVL